MNVQVSRFLAQLEQLAAAEGRAGQRFGAAGVLFIETVWGPAFDFDFAGLTWTEPFEGPIRRRSPSCTEFTYERSNLKLLVQLDAPLPIAGAASYAEYDAWLLRSNRLLLEGWLPLRFSLQQLVHRPHECRDLLRRVVLGSSGAGGSGSGCFCLREQGASYGAGPPNERELWRRRKTIIIELAASRQGQIRAHEVAAVFNVSSRAAVVWLKRFVLEGLLTVISGPQQAAVFMLREGIR